MKRIKNLNISFLLIVALCLSSCGIYKPYSRPDVKTDNLFGENIPIAVNDSSESIAKMKWEDLFNDPYLQKLISQGLENNTDLRIAKLKIEESEASLMSARLSYLPSLSLNPQGTLTGFDGSKAIKSYQLPAVASWEIDIFGKQTNIVGQKKAALSQSEFYSQGIKTQLIATIANSYYTLLMLDSQLEISVKTSMVWEENITAMRYLKNAGQTNEAAITQAEANKYSVDANIIELQLQITEVENSLCSVLAIVPQKIERGDFCNRDFPEEISTGIPLELLSLRPDVKMAEAALRQAYYATNEARSYFYPSLTLSGNAGWTNSGGIGVSNPGAFLSSAVGSLTQPVFANGANKARLKISKAQQEEALLTFQQTLFDAGGEVNTALAGFQSAKDKVSVYERQVKALESTVNDTKILMKYGSASYLEVLTAQQTLLQAQLNQVSNNFDELQSIITLYRALGGGSDN